MTGSGGHEDEETMRGRAEPRSSRPETRVLAVASAIVIVAAGLTVGSQFMGRATSASNQTVGPRAHLARNGLIAFSGGRFPGGPFTPSNLFVVDADGSGLRQLSHDDLRRSSLAWSPDGSRIAYIQTGGEFPPWNIFIASADGQQVQQLTHQIHQFENGPAWSPDGRRVVFARGGADEPYELYVIAADGSNLRRLTSGGGNHLDPTWSPDGRRIAFVAASVPNSGLTHLFVMDADGSGPHRITPYRGFEDDPAWSPDGALIAFVLRGVGHHPPDRLILIGPDGSDPVSLYRCDADCAIQSVAWAPDGTKLVMALALGSDTARDPTSRLVVLSRDGGVMREVGTGSVNACCASWQPLP
jgi:TolB protein